MMLFKILFSFCLALATHVSSETVIQMNENTSYPHTAADDYILHRSIPKILEKFPLICYGEGGALMREIHIIHLAFQTDQELNIDSARNIIVTCIQEILDVANTDEVVRPYLHNFPFAAKNLDILIVSMHPNADYTKQKSLRSVSTYNGNIIYNIKVKNNRSQPVLKETYQEALEKPQPTKNEYEE